MARRQQLTETQLAALFDPPAGHREMVRHYALSADDLALVGRRRGDHSRLGHALMLCYLRHPGRPLRAGEGTVNLLALRRPRWLTDGSDHVALKPPQQPR